MPRVCIHLVEEPDPEYAQYFSGSGVECALVCLACIERPFVIVVFDRYLFSSSVEEGISVWDVTTGERLLREASFCPTAYHPGSGQFITVRPDGTIRLSRLVVSWS
jgi:hypothetical protein